MQTTSRFTVSCTDVFVVGTLLVFYRAIKVVDTLSHEILDPQITVHWSNVSTADESLIKIAFTSQGYENVRYVCVHLKYHM